MKTLDKLYRRSSKRIFLLRLLASRMRSSSGAEADRIASYVCINALNVLAEFNRTYFGLALENGVTRSGIVVATRFPKGTTIESALNTLHPPGATARPRGGRRFEPSWHTMPKFFSILQAAAVSTAAQIGVTMGLPVRVMHDLPTLRNFFAHRNGETAQKSRRLLNRYYSVAVGHPSSMLGNFSSARPTTILEDWMAELEIVFDTMSQ